MALNYTLYCYDRSNNSVVPASYVSIAMRLGGLQEYVDVWNELN
jgi:hypothetical protein